MNREEARDRVQELLGPVAALLAPNDLDEALDRAKTWDDEGRAPNHPDWEPTYDPYWAAAECATWLAIRAAGEGGMTEFTSEGSTFKYTGPDFWAMARALRALSPMSPEYGTGLGVIQTDGHLSLFRPATDEYRTGRGIVGNWS